MHGRLLRSEIAQAIDFYRGIFGMPENSVLERAGHFQKVIAEFNGHYADEIAAIAEGSGQPPLWIVALNARTEILALGQKTDVNECTSMCFTGPPVIGQTWDWGKTLEALSVVMTIARDDGHLIVMLTEPGIIGKIGMNNAGLGVCLNILSLDQPLDGVPIHIILRAILDCRSAAEAMAVIERAPSGKSSNVIVADRSGHCFDLEFAGGQTLGLEPLNGNHIHTNHYLGKQINGADDPLFLDSQTRLKTAMDRASAMPDDAADTMMEILSDRTHGLFPIYRPYVPHDLLRDVGTVATIVMDLPARHFHIRKGNHSDAPFTAFDVH